MADVGTVNEAINDFGDRRYEEGLAAGRAEVKAAVEEWFTDVSLDDLFAVKGWRLGAEYAVAVAFERSRP